MASLKNITKAATKFRRTEPSLHRVISNAIDHMAFTIRKTSAPEVCVVVRNGNIKDSYAID